MSLHFIIDGCNIVNHPSFARNLTKGKGDTRILLLQFILSRGACGSLNNRVSVVFDGFPTGQEGLAAYRGRIAVMFSSRRSADEVIKKLIERQPHPASVVLVTDDKELRFFGRALGVRPLGALEFICGPQERSRARSRREELLKPELSSSQIRRINKELEGLWL